MWVKVENGRIEPVELRDEQAELQAEKLHWLDTAGNEFRRREEERRLRHRLEGMSEAVGRWRRKAGVKAPPAGPILRSVKVYEKAGRQVMEKQYSLPVERAPELVREALEYIAASPDFLLGAELLYVSFQPGVGWIAAIREDS
jgi:hypothetical protein